MMDSPSSIHAATCTPEPEAAEAVEATPPFSVESEPLMDAPSTWLIVMQHSATIQMVRR